MNHVNAILFDLDDTLIVELDSARASFIETIQSLDSGIDKEEFVKVIREEARKLWYELPTIEYSLKIGISSWEALWADFDGEDENLRKLSQLASEYRISSWANALARFGFRDMQLAEKMSETFKKLRNTKHILYPETLTCLNELKPFCRLGLVTNGAPDLQWKKINGGNLKSFFNTIVISGEHGFAKPDTRLFMRTLRVMDTKPENAIMVGDNLKTDIKGAKETGIHTVWINREGKTYEDQLVQPDFEIDNLLQIINFIH